MNTNDLRFLLRQDGEIVLQVRTFEKKYEWMPEFKEVWHDVPVIKETDLIGEDE